ncbi:hypothetical protein [Pectobacterium versatile]|uniref:hypothetical protein n=1 Tax=Pectobacterium versatile TaxID=2488639 RepID=UPI0015DEB8A3|nr:hypothetical protein [Pectobacterium versatile]MBA0170865.1 hypothetical protein [Pectobacterium versatile]
MNGIFRPFQKYENEQYQRVKAKVFSVFTSGHITKLDEVISVCLVMFDEHEAVFVENIDRIDTLDLIIFALNEYEAYARVNSLYYNHSLSASDEKEWLSYASHARRGIKYLMEYLCQFYMTLSRTKKNKLSDSENGAVLSRIFISIEEMCSTYMRVDSYKFLCDRVDLFLNEEEFVYFNVPQDAEPKNNLDIRNEKKQVLPLISGKPYGHNIEEHSKVLETSFYKNLGVSYHQLINFLRSYIESQHSSVAIIPKEKIISDLQQACQISYEQAINAIHGFSVRTVKLENRKLFNPKQEHRAYHRGFFEFMDEDIPVLIFSKVMALEALDILINNTCYQKLPEEWRTPAVDLQLASLSNKAGKWFEKILNDNLKTVAVSAISSVERYRWQKKVITPPDNVGEIDFIGYCPKNDYLFVIEAKNVRFNTEPKLFRDDLSKFITGSKSYASKFNAKHQWVVENLPIVISELKMRGIEVRKVKKVFKVMVIFFPSPVEDRIFDFSCVNLVKFMQIMKGGDLSSLASIDV